MIIRGEAHSGLAINLLVLCCCWAVPQLSQMQTRRSLSTLAWLRRAASPVLSIRGKVACSPRAALIVVVAWSFSGASLVPRLRVVGVFTAAVSCILARHWIADAWA